MNINLKFKFRGAEYTFQKEVVTGEVATFEIGEESLADKLFAILSGLDNGFCEGVWEGTPHKEINFMQSKYNNVLALGEGSMFGRGDIKKNLYRAYRLRADKVVAAAQLAAQGEIPQVKAILDLKPKNLDSAQMLDFALARAYHRNVKLVVMNCVTGYLCDLTTEKINCLENELFTKFPNCYIIKIV